MSQASARWCAPCAGHGYTPPDDNGTQRMCQSCLGTGVPTPTRFITIRERLDRAIVDGFGGWAREDLIDDLRWLLDENKRLRRCGP